LVAWQARVVKMLAAWVCTMMMPQLLECLVHHTRGMCTLWDGLE
jgi:hypothetical protein